MFNWSKYLLLISFSLLIFQCGGTKENNTVANPYADDSLWLCKPGLSHDYCFDDLTATEIKPNGASLAVPFTPAAQTDFDCFYIYPTVDLTGPVGNHTDFSDVSPMLVPLQSQAARFSGLCTVYAPLYRQITISTYANPKKDEYLEIAYGDVHDAFTYYLEHFNQGRPFVLLGHSQGSTMLRMLLQREFDQVPELRSLLITALLIGGDVLVPPGEKVGATFQNLPLCASETETGCVLAFRSYAEGYPPPEDAFGSNTILPGTDLACTNPASGAKAWVEGAYLPNRVIYGGMNFEIVPGISTPFALYRDFYTSRCAQNQYGISYLEIGVAPSAGDVRSNPVDFNSVIYEPSLLGLHVLDYNLTLGDLIRQVRVKADNFPQP
ncbi:MAG: DUF3089 domain-containing protein [Proteobacteria bacterium]|nr:DUF3089 domain-containing protein [Pseudomonadota bacterium]